MRTVRRFISLFLTVGLVLSLFAGFSLTAFAEDEVSLHFYGAEVEALTGVPGEDVNLPSVNATLDGYTFLGWTSAEVAKTQTAPDYYPADSSYTLPAEDTALYALYSFVDHRDAPSFDRYEKITSMDELKDGAYLIGVPKSGNQLFAFDGSSENPNASGNYQILNLDSSNTVLCTEASDACSVRVFRIAGSDSYGILMNGTGRFIGSTGKSGLSTRAKDPYPLTVVFDNGIVVYVAASDKENTNYYLSFYQTTSTQKFGFYNNKSSSLVDFYRKIDGVDGSLWFTGMQIPCDHEGTEGVLIEPTCTEIGYTAFVCPTCGYKWTVDDAPAHGHSYEATEVVAPTDWDSGYTVYVCSVCGDTCHGNPTEPTGEYNVTFSVLGVETTQKVSFFRGIELPSDPGVHPDGYEFAGWSTIDYINDVENAYIYNESDLDPKDHKLHPTYDITLYAVYMHGGEGTGSGDYEKLTQLPPLGLNGKFLVVCESSSIAFNSAFGESATNINKARNFLPVTITDGMIEQSDELDAAAVEIGKVDGTSNYYMKVNCGLCIGSTGSTTANGINGKAGTVYQNAITFDENGNVIIANAPATSTGSKIYNFAYNSSSVNRFCYCNPTTETVRKVALYQKLVNTPVTFTTAPVTANCEHEEYRGAVTEPTCEAQGYTTYTCSNCGYQWKANYTDPIGHDLDAGVVTPPTPTAFGYTTYSCQREGCTYSEQREYTGYTFEILCSVLGVEQEPIYADAYNGVQLPETAMVVPGYKFIGWSEEEITDEVDIADILTGSYKPSEDTVLFAVYSRLEANEGSGDYVKVTQYPLAVDGNYLLVDESKGIAFKAYDASNADYDLTAKSNYLKVMVEDGVIPASDEVDKASLKINPVGNTATYTMSIAALTDKTHYVGTTGNGTGMMTNTRNPYPVRIDFDFDAAVITNTEGNNQYQLFFNTQSTSDKFGFYATTNKTVDGIALYWKDGSGSTEYFTTRPEIDCLHTNTVDVAASEPDCTTPGYTAGVFCNDCHTWVSGHETVDKIPHNYIKNETAETTCGQDGFITWVCSVCENSYEEILPATGDHTYSAGGVCTECGYKLINIETATIRLDEDIDVIYTAKVPEGAEAVMTFTMNGKSIEVKDDGTHTFVFAGVNPQCMGDNISAVLTVSLGDDTYTDAENEYSIREYCVDQLAKGDISAELRTLLSDVLAYGAAAQTYVRYQTETIVNTGDDIENPSYSTYKDLSEDDSNLWVYFEGGPMEEDVSWMGVGLTLKNSVTMNFRFYAERIEDLTVTVSVNGRTQNFTASDFTAIAGKEGCYEVSFAGVKATEFDDLVHASCSRNGTIASSTVKYKVNTYICMKQNDSDSDLADLVKALYNYGASAAAYAE